MKREMDGSWSCRVLQQMAVIKENKSHCLQFIIQDINMTWTVPRMFNIKPVQFCCDIPNNVLSS